MPEKPANLYTLKQLLEHAEAGCYAVGAFSPRSTALIRPILLAGEALRSPLIVQVAQAELERYGMIAADFAAAFYEEMEELAPTIPVGLHLDHTKKWEVIESAIANGFTSVMIDASDQDLNENINITQRVVEFAHARGVSVEAELGRIGTGDFVETDQDIELYTDPQEAEIFVRATGVDALAVSVGTVHGVYKVRKPKIDLARIQAIHLRTPVHLVLHGGSGNPPELIRASVCLPGGGVSKINIATDLELALLEALNMERPLKNEELKVLPGDMLDLGRAAVQSVVKDKIINYLGSQDQAWTL